MLYFYYAYYVFLLFMFDDFIVKNVLIKFLKYHACNKLKQNKNSKS